MLIWELPTAQDSPEKNSSNCLSPKTRPSFLVKPALTKSLLVYDVASADWISMYSFRLFTLPSVFIHKNNIQN